MKDPAAVLRLLQQKIANKRCFDCDALGTTYVVPQFGVFVCTECSGKHMNAGQRVKSVSMGKFTAEEIQRLEDGGNEAAACTYLAKWKPDGDAGRPANRNPKAVEAWISAVFLDRKYYSAAGAEPQELVQASSTDVAYPVRSMADVLGGSMLKLQVNDGPPSTSSPARDPSITSLPVPAAGNNNSVRPPIRSLLDDDFTPYSQPPAGPASHAASQPQIPTPPAAANGLPQASARTSNTNIPLPAPNAFSVLGPQHLPPPATHVMYQHTTLPPTPAAPSAFPALPVASSDSSHTASRHSSSSSGPQLSPIVIPSTQSGFTDSASWASFDAPSSTPGHLTTQFPSEDSPFGESAFPSTPASTPAAAQAAAALPAVLPAAKPSLPPAKPVVPIMTAPLSLDMFCEPAFAPSASPQYYQGQAQHQQAQHQQAQQQQAQHQQAQHQQAQAYSSWGPGIPQQGLNYAGVPTAVSQSPGQFQFPHSVQPTAVNGQSLRPASAGSGNPFGLAPAGDAAPAYVQAVHHSSNLGLHSSAGGDASFARGLQQVPMPFATPASTPQPQNGNPFA